MIHTLREYIQKPSLYAPSTAKFWDDDYISKGMLEAHLNPTLDSATRNISFVQASIQWIAKVAPRVHYPSMLDLGCGPGIYTTLFDDAVYEVSGIDLSPRSIDYALCAAHSAQKTISYRVADYLTMDYANQFDLITLIYCDFGVLSPQSRAQLLRNIHRALKPHGCLIFDVFTPMQYLNQKECTNWVYENEGFWGAKPYLHLYSLYRYDEQHTYLNQHIIISQHDLNCYNIWEHTFTPSELTANLNDAEFAVKDFYGDAAGAEYSADTKQICVVAEKK